MHVIGTMVLDAAEMTGGYDFKVLKKLFAERMHLLPSFRRRVVEVPFGLAQPVWVEDPEFDLDHHLRRAAVPSPGSLHELAEFVSDYASRPLERSKPLWEAALVEGLEGGRVAVVTKLHHAMMDGGAGMELLGVLFNVKPGEEEIPPSTERWNPEPLPSAATLLAWAVLEQITRPVRVVQALTEAGRGVGASLLSGRSGSGSAKGPEPPKLFEAPRTSFNHALSPHRSVGFWRSRLADFKQVAKAFDAKVNDVVLAACTSALRGYLEDLGELPEVPLVASVPIALRAKPDGDGGNHISMMLIPLPVHEPDPIERLRTIRLATRRGKEGHTEAGGNVIQNVTDVLSVLSTPGLLAGLMEAYSSSHLADRLPPMWNVVISNMPGPPVPLYCAGARVEAIYPMGPVVDGCGLNFTVLSNADDMDIGIMACRELVKDVEGLGLRFAEGLDELLNAAAVRQ